jgi:hypothetical protein
MYEVLSESSRTVIFVTALPKDERGPVSYIHKPISSVCHVTPRCEHAFLSHECFLKFVFSFVCDGWQNQAICQCQVLHEVR